MLARPTSNYPNEIIQRVPFKCIKARITDERRYKRFGLLLLLGISKNVAGVFAIELRGSNRVPYKMLEFLLKKKITVCLCQKLPAVLHNKSLQACCDSVYVGSCLARRSGSVDWKWPLRSCS